MAGAAAGVATDNATQAKGVYFVSRSLADGRRRLEAAADALGFEFQGTFAKRVDGKFVGYGVEEWRLD